MIEIFYKHSKKFVLMKQTLHFEGVFALLGLNQQKKVQVPNRLSPKKEWTIKL